MNAILLLLLLAAMGEPQSVMKSQHVEQAEPQKPSPQIRQLMPYDEGDFIKRQSQPIKEAINKTPGLADRYADDLIKPLDRVEHSRAAANRTAGAIEFCQHYAILSAAGVTLPHAYQLKARKIFLDRLREHDAGDRFTSLWILLRIATKDDLARIEAALVVETDYTNECAAARLVERLGDPASAAGHWEHEAITRPELSIEALSGQSSDEAKGALERLSKRLPKFRDRIDRAIDRIDGRGA